jgi:hypothetical protein
MNAAREAFDLHNPGCVKIFKLRFKDNKWNLRWWKTVLSDTVNRVCSKEEADHER